jgi:hypothetical protein
MLLMDAQALARAHRPTNHIAAEPVDHVDRGVGIEEQTGLRLRQMGVSLVSTSRREIPA